MKGITMTRTQLISFAFATLMVLGLARIAEAHYAPDMGRWLSRDPLGTLNSNPMGSIQSEGNHVIGVITADRESQSEDWQETLDRFSFDPTTQYDDGMNLYQYGPSNPLVGTDPAGGPWRLIIRKPLQKRVLTPIGTGIGKKVGQKIGERQARRQAERIARHQRNRRIAKCTATYNGYKSLNCRGCDGVQCCSEAVGRANCLAAEISGRQLYLNMRCDSILPKSISRGSNNARAGHRQQLAEKRRAAAKCAAKIAKLCN